MFYNVANILKMKTIIRINLLFSGSPQPVVQIMHESATARAWGEILKKLKKDIPGVSVKYAYRYSVKRKNKHLDFFQDNPTAALTVFSNALKFTEENNKLRH